MNSENIHSPFKYCASHTPVFI